MPGQRIAPADGMPPPVKGLRIAVTGAYGFIGRRLVARLSAGAAWVTAITRRDNTETPTGWGDNVTVLRRDLLDRPAAGQVPWRDFDAVFHLGGKSFVPVSFQDPVSDIHDNTVLTVALLDALQRAGAHPKLIVASSAAVYGNVTDIPVPEDAPLRPESPYGLSKLAAEHYLRFFARKLDARTAIARLFSVYGPGQRKLAVHDLIRKIVETPGVLEVIGTGEEVRDFIHVDEVIDAFLLILTRGDFTGAVYNVGSGTGTRITDLVATICAAMDVRPECRYTNAALPGYPSVWTADISRLKKLGFEPRVSLQAGVKSTASWFLAERARSAAPVPDSR